MIEINVSKNKDYYTQRNNEIRGTSACNVTSAAAFITVNEPKQPFVPKDMQLEDFLMATLIGKDGYDEMFRVAETLYPQYTPNEVHACLSWAINRVCESPVAVFKADWTIEQMLFSLVKGKAVIISGKFGSLHHIVCLVGFQTSQRDIKEIRKVSDIRTNKVKSFIIDDPWGDPNTDYKDTHGNDVILTHRQFMETIKPQKQLLKWGHLHRDVVKSLKEEK